MLSKLLYLRPGELGRLLPFFALYLWLFAAFALADGLALALFVKHRGAAGLPRAFAAVAIANVIVIGLYIAAAECYRAAAVFRLILAGNILIFGAAWIGLQYSTVAAWYHALFVCREIAFTLMLMHFGTFLQGYFTREEMDRVLPLVYSGGRLGGLVGGALLEFLADPLGLVHLLGVFVVLCACGVIGLTIIDRFAPHQPAADDPAAAASAEHEAGQTYVGFLRFVWQSPLLFWITVTTLLFIICRWFLNFQYSTFLGAYYEDEEDLAEFLGRYTQIALVIAIIVQVLLVNRLIAWLGLRGAHLIYSVFLLAGMILCIGEMTLFVAILARFVETELRFGLRNPIHQLITNEFPKSLRVRVRAWSFGIVIPAGTFISSVLLASWSEDLALIPWLGAGCAALYFACTFGLLRSIQIRRSPA